MKLKVKHFTDEFKLEVVQEYLNTVSYPEIHLPVS